MTADLREALRADDFTSMDGHAAGPRHIRLADGAVVTIETWQEMQRHNLERHDPPPPAPTPRPARAELEANLADARRRRNETAAKCAKADAALARAVEIAAAARCALDDAEAQEEAANAGAIARVRDWIASGSRGIVPRGKDVTEIIARHEAARRDCATARGAVIALEAEAADAKSKDDDALAVVEDVARGVLSDDATAIAEQIEKLEIESARLWASLHALAFSAPGGVALPLHASARAALNAPPTMAARGGVPLSRLTAASRAAIEAVRERFNALVAGEHGD